MLLAGCSVFGLGGTDPHLYDSIDAVVAELDLESVGEIVHEGHYGTGGFSSDPVTAEVIVELRTSPQALERAIGNAGFTELITTSWERGSGASRILVRYVTIDAGEAVATGDGTEIKVTKDSALVGVTSFE